jgi:hypothetical protein
MSDRESIAATLPTELFRAFKQVDDCAIRFYRHDKQVGKLDFGGPKMTFEGDADASVDAFVTAFANWFDYRVKEVAATLAQPERKPLTEEERERMLEDYATHGDIVRAVEKAHGIGGGET